MRRGETVPASVRAERSREATKAAMARELLFVGVLARIWPAYLTEPLIAQPGFPALVCLDTPLGLLVWRLSADEAPFFDYLEHRPNDGRAAEDKVGILYALGADGWL